MEKSLELVRQLVNDFREHEKAYLTQSYSEQQARSDFINKFFTALGWDVNHERQKNPYEQEVKIENPLRTEGTQRRADYAFFVAPNFRDVKFFVEAKKPAHDLANANYYYQTVRYGWNKTTPIAVLTDFEEFHILDCRFKPNIKTVLDHKIESFHYSQYTDEEIFKKIFYLFGRDAVAGGSLENFVQTLPKPRGKGKGIVRGKYQQVDEAFLELLDGYRDTLAHAFKNKNPHLDGESLTEAVQRTLDRLVFIRFLEDKGIEEQAISQLRLGGSSAQKTADKSNSRPLQVDQKRSGAKLPPSSGGAKLLPSSVSVWEKFLTLCRSMEPKYNGLVFKPHPVIDSQTFVAPDDKTFGEICEEISDPASPYDFNTIPISILGSIYERFLGKIVTTTDKRAKVVEKPEVRKAGGVYYTPEYIVRYIVNETVGKLLYEEQGVGFSNEGIGFNNNNVGGENYGVTNVQGTGSVEAGNVVGGRNLQADGVASQGGTIRIEEPNAASGGLNSGEHSGGVRTGESEGIPSIPVVRTGIIDGIGNTFGDSSAGYSAEAGTSITGNIVDGRSGQDANASDSISQNPLNPNPYSQNPIPYTPKFKLTPAEAAKLKIIDIACGSGSFLLEVYSQLLDYHTRYYNEFPEKAKKGDTETREGKIVLSHKKRQEILVNNIYGVDIDFQATEVTQLSLYLKLMEDVTMNDAYQFSLLKERMLPDLRRNIVCGNSLIGRDILDGKLFDDETERTLKPMNFEDVFPEIMTPSVPTKKIGTSPPSQGGEKEGVEKKASSGGGPSTSSGHGFDVVVGNPPYGATFDLVATTFLEKRFKTYVGRGESYVLFVERALELLKHDGYFGYIIPDTYLNLGFTKALRDLLLQNAKIREVVRLPSTVFSGAIVDTTILNFQKDHLTKDYHPVDVQIRLFNRKSKITAVSNAMREFRIHSGLWFQQDSFNLESNETENRILDKIENANPLLADYADMFSGIKAYEVGKGDPPQNEKVRDSKPFTSEKKKGNMWSPLFDGKHIGRYELLWQEDNWVHYGKWLAAPREENNFIGAKLLIRKIVGKTLLATYIPYTSFCNTLLFILKIKPGCLLRYEYLLGILNSKLFGWYFRKKF
ncbi:MAG: N-6 DNA methylase, partial [Ignavibacteriales bacterium]|nr:N-6 DNA methylase [Ignavibacteriales bacterium]